MKKQIISLSIAAAVAVGFTGCMGGGSSLSVPNAKDGAKAREQTIDPKILKKVASKGNDEYLMVIANKRFKAPFECKVAYNAARNSIIEKDIKDDVAFAKLISNSLSQAGLDCVKDNRTVSVKKLGEFKDSQKDFYELVSTIASEVNNIFKERDGFIAENESLELLKPKNIDSLDISIIKGYSKLTARYFPVGKIVFSDIDFDKLKSDNVYKTQVAFLIAHEMVHAYALHTSEEMTNKAEMDVVAEVAINQAYKLLNPSIQKIVDKGAEVLAKGLLTKADYDYDNKVVKERSESMAAKALMVKPDKLELIGVGLTIPQTTKLVIMERVSAEFGKSIDEAVKSAIAMLSSNSKDLEIELGAHPHSQEFESDALALKIINGMKLKTSDAISVFDDALVKEGTSKQSVTSHPKASDRVLKLKAMGI